MSSAELNVSRNAPWLRPMEWASYRPLSVFAWLTAVLFIIWSFLSEDDISPLVALIMVAAFQVGMLMHCYLLRFVRKDLVALREFDPSLEDFSELMPTRRVAMVEMLICISYAIFGMFALGGIFFAVPATEFIGQWREMPGVIYFLYILFFFSNIALAEVILFSIRLVRLMSRYAKQIRISIFRYRLYSIFSGLFVLVFSGFIILSCMVMLIGPFLNFNNVLATISVLSTGAPISLLISIPIFIISRRMAAARDKELARVENLIDEETQAHGEKLNPELEQLLTYERQVLDIWVWPFSTQIKQLLLFGLLPPLSWLLGAFIEIAVEGSL